MWSIIRKVEDVVEMVLLLIVGYTFQGAILEMLIFTVKKQCWLFSNKIIFYYCFLHSFGWNFFSLFWLLIYDLFWQETQKNAIMDSLMAAQRYCMQTTCRRKILLEYFGEIYPSNNCGKDLYCLFLLYFIHDRCCIFFISNQLCIGQAIVL